MYYAAYRLPIKTRELSIDIISETFFLFDMIFSFFQEYIDQESFSVVSSAAPIPVLVAGGPSTGNARAIITMVHEAMDAGASGVCMGRQVFAHPQREDLARALMMIVHENADVEHALSSNGL